MVMIIKGMSYMEHKPNTYKILYRRKVEINTDPQRRCYYGVHASSKIVWTDWDWIELEVPQDKIEARLTFWRELNAYAVSQRGTVGTQKEFKAVLNT